MSYCKKEGKDQIIFVTKEDHEAPIQIDFNEDDDDEQPGIILPNGEINWNCPCLGGMATGPCGVEFREAFSCFQYSTATPKGSDCFDRFHEMQQCMVKYPNLYPQADPIMDDDEDESRSTSDDKAKRPVRSEEMNDVTSSKSDDSGLVVENQTSNQKMSKSTSKQ